MLKERGAKSIRKRVTGNRECVTKMANDNQGKERDEKEMQSSRRRRKDRIKQEREGEGRRKVL